MASGPIKAKNGLQIVTGVFDGSDSTGALELPKGTTAERPGSPSLGVIRGNTTNTRVEFYENGAWREIVRRGGDTLTGFLTLHSSVPTNSLHAASKGYVDTKFDALGGAAVDSKVNRSGDSMEGALTVLTPVDPSHAATKAYVDAVQVLAEAAQDSADAADANADLRVLKAGDTMTGTLTAPTFGLDANGSLTLSSGVVTLNLDANDRIDFTRVANTIDFIIGSTTRLSLSNTGCSFSVVPTYSSNPTANNHLSRKAYVDTVPVTKSSVANGTWTGSTALLTSDTSFFTVAVPSGTRRIIGTAFMACSNTDTTLATATFDVILRNSSNAEVARHTIGFIRSKADVALYGSAGGPIGFTVSAGNTGFYLDFVARKDVAAGPFNILNYLAHAMFVTD